MDTSTSVAQTGVTLPTYDLLPSLLRALEHASSIEPTFSDDGGEFFGMAMAAVVAAEAVLPNSVMILPLNEPLEGAPVDFTFLAASNLLFIQLHDEPQQRMTYGHCLQYSAGVIERPLDLGTYVKFPSATNLRITKQRLLSAVRLAGETNISQHGRTETAKKPCLRPLTVMGEAAEEVEEKPKGTLQYLLDLDGTKHYTRNKTDLQQREKDLYFVFRGMCREKSDDGISPDWVLQPIDYQSMLLQQADNRSGNRHVAFTSCGLVSRVTKIGLVHNITKLKLLMTGAVLLHGKTSPSLTLDDFASSDKISTKSTVCPSNNSGLITALKNFQTIMQIVFSDCFESSLEAFINNLEGVYRPMELVSADFLKFSVELTLREFFRVVRSVKSTALSAISVSTPGECAIYLTHLFDDLRTDLSNHSTRTEEEEYFSLRVARENASTVSGQKIDTAAKITPGKSPKAGSESDVKKAPTKLCLGDLGGQLGAVKFNGRPYACGYGKECTFQHVPIEGKTKKRLMELAESLPGNAQKNIVRAIQARK